MERIVSIHVSFWLYFQGELSANSLKTLQFHEFPPTFFWRFQKYIVCTFRKKATFLKEYDRQHCKASRFLAPFFQQNCIIKYWKIYDLLRNIRYDFHSCFFWLTGFKEKYRLSEDDRKRCKATLERLRYELNTDEVVAGDCDCNVVSQAVRDLDLAQGSYNTH